MHLQCALTWSHFSCSYLRHGGLPTSEIRHVASAASAVRTECQSMMQKPMHNKEFQLASQNRRKPKFCCQERNVEGDRITPILSITFD